MPKNVYRWRQIAPVAVVWGASLAMLILWRAMLPRGLFVGAGVLFVLAVVLLYLARPRSVPITRRDLEEAPAWTIFSGPAEDPGPLEWGVMEISPATPYPEGILAKMEALHVVCDEPQRDDEAEEKKDDIDAALAYLRSGGTLCKVPDEEGSKYWRLLVVETKK